MIPLAIRKAASTLPAKIRRTASTLLRKFRSITERQWKIAGLAFLALMAAGPIWFLIYDLMGRKAWKDYEAAERARGAKLYLSDFEEPRVPDNENFAALPIFKNTLNVHQRLPELPETHGKTQPGDFAIPELGRTFTAEAWRTYFARSGWIDTPSEDVASDLRLALLPYRGALLELEEGLGRPHCAFNITWSPDPRQTPFHYSSIASQTITIAALRGHVSLVSGDTTAALRDVRLIEGIRGRIAQKQSLAHRSLRSIGRYEMCIIYEGLSRHAWSANQLREIIALLGTIDPLKELFNEFEVDRALANGTCEWILTSNVPMANDPLSFDPSTWMGSFKFHRTFPGIVRRNQLVTNHYHSTACGQIDIKRGFCEPLEDWSLKKGYRYYGIARVLTGGYGGKVRSALIRAAKVRLAVVACGLELYHIQHARYPANLTELAPDCLTEIPSEPTGHRDFVYYPTDDGRYRLYSRGADGQDNDGRLGRFDNLYERDLIDVPWIAPPPP